MEKVCRCMHLMVTCFKSLEAFQGHEVYISDLCSYVLFFTNLGKLLLWKFTQLCFIDLYIPCKVVGIYLAYLLWFVSVQYVLMWQSVNERHYCVCVVCVWCVCACVCVMCVHFTTPGWLLLKWTFVSNLMFLQVSMKSSQGTRNSILESNQSW